MSILPSHANLENNKCPLNILFLGISINQGCQEANDFFMSEP